MINLLKLAINIHLILSFNLIFTLFILAIKKTGVKKFLRDLKSDSNLWYVLLLFLLAPYQVILIGIGQVGKKANEVLNKIKAITQKSKEKQ